VRTTLRYTCVVKWCKQTLPFCGWPPERPLCQWNTDCFSVFCINVKPVAGITVWAHFSCAQYFHYVSSNTKYCVSVCLSHPQTTEGCSDWGGSVLSHIAHHSNYKTTRCRDQYEHKVTATAVGTSNLTNSGLNQDYSLLECNSVWYDRHSSTFRRNVPPSLGCNSVHTMTMQTSGSSETSVSFISKYDVIFLQSVTFTTITVTTPNLPRADQWQTRSYITLPRTHTNKHKYMHTHARTLYVWDMQTMSGYRKQEITVSANGQ
jgi:hypothetical protein